MTQTFGWLFVVIVGISNIVWPRQNATYYCEFWRLPPPTEQFVRWWVIFSRLVGVTMATAGLVKVLDAVGVW